MGEWFDTFFDGLYARVLPHTFDEAKSLEQARLVRRLLKLRKDARALDIPCGMGRLTLPLARTGLRMTGVDLTVSYIRRARRAARRAGVPISFTRRDMREIRFDAEFDAAFNWFGSFGYFSDADNLTFCRRVWRALKPGGRFLVEGMNKSWLLAHFRPRSDQTIAGVRIVQRNKWRERTGRVVSTWTFHKGDVTERHRVSMRIYNGAEMRSLLRKAGFRDVQLFGYPPAGRLTRHSRRIIAVARRPH